MNKLLFIAGLISIALGSFVIFTSTSTLLVLGCSIYVIEMILTLADTYIHKLPKKLAKPMFDISSTIPGWCFIAEFVSTNQWFLTFLMSIISLCGLIGVYYNHKNNQK